MPGLHLPRAPYDKLVYDFSFDVGGIVGGYDVCVYNIYEHRAISCIGPRGEAVANPYRGCSKVVRISCNFNAVAVLSLQPPHGNRTEPVQLPCKGSAEKARWPFSRRAVLSCFFLHVYRKIVRLLHDQCESSARCPCGDCAMTPTTCLRTTGLRFFKFV